MTQTEKIVIQMLRENTGTHFLDSGSIYGRNWQRNQAKKFTREPEARLDIFGYKDKDGQDWIELNVTLSVFHFLTAALEYEPKLDKQFQTFAQSKQFVDAGWLEIAETFVQSLKDNGKFADEPSHTFNSYNGEDFLSQVIQGVVLGEYEGIVLLQIHGGYDVRGGYTKPHVFRWNMDWETSLSDNARASVYCKNGHGWHIEPGYSQEWNDGPKLDSFPNHILAKGEKPQIGKLCAREDDSKAYCPICASELKAGR